MIETVNSTHQAIDYNAFILRFVGIVFPRTECRVNKALNDFLAQHEQAAFRMAKFAVNSTDDAHDIVQEAMFKLVDKYESKPAEQWAPLFHRIMQHQITQWHRRQQRFTRWFAWLGNDEVEHNTAVAETVDETAIKPEHYLANNQAMRHLEKAISLLPLRQKQAFLCRCLEGLSVEETANAMACSTGSVKTHYHRALTSIRSGLTEDLQ